MNAPDPRRRAAIGMLLELRSVPLFRELGAEQLKPVAEIAGYVRHEAGEVLFEPQDLGDRLYVIAEGSVELSAEGEAPEVLWPGDCFGELALLESLPRHRRAKAVEPATLLTIGRQEFELILQGHPDIARAMAEVLAERLRRSLESSEPLSRRL